MAQKIQLEVSKKEQVTEKVYMVTFRLVSPPIIDFRAGQNMMIMIAPGINRTMSIASPPSQSTELLMVHDVSPMGPGSKWTVGLNVGDTATVVAPTGGALSLVESPRKKVLIATGAGIAPFHAMVLDYFERRAEVGHDTALRSAFRVLASSRSSSQSVGSVGNAEAMTTLRSETPPRAGNSLLQSAITLYWGLRYESDVYWKEEFDRIAREHPTFTWHQVLSKPTDAWQGLRGHVTEHVLSMEKDMPNSDFYL